MGLICLLYRSVLGRLVVQWWQDPDFSHGFFVPLFALGLVWHKRLHLCSIPQAPSWVGFFPILGSLSMLVVGTFGAELFLARCSFLFLLAGLILFFHGWPRFRALLFPWALLFLMIPPPTIIFNQVTLPLQFLVSGLAGSTLPLFGVPALCEGNVIKIPAMSLEVAQACSGIRSLLSLGTLAIIYGYFAETRALGRVLLALATIPIAIAANVLRIVGTGLLVQYWEPDKGEGFFHSFSGWIIFLSALFILISMHKLLRLLLPAAPAGSRA